MRCNIQIFKKYIFYIILILSITVINSFVFKKVYASNYDVENIIINENFNKDFKKEDVFDKAFIFAFNKLILTLLTSEDKEKIINTNIYTIKRLIDSFNINNERFVNDNYTANFTVSFNKKNTLNFLEKKNIFPSIPKKISLLLIPILIENDKNNIKYFNENNVYLNWNVSKDNHELIKYILPEDEIDDREMIDKNFSDIESYDFKELISKYNIENYIIVIINQNKKDIKILSKIYINNNYEIINLNFENQSLKNEKNLNDIINFLKIKYEDVWKNYNIINTSIKLPITLLINSKDKSKIEMFEKFVENYDLISTHKILKFNNVYIYYKLIFSGSPKTFFDEAKKNGLIFIEENQNWVIE
ncbi:MAG: hypothetical protein CBE47_03020 [Pelagibacteraceae bacterium TMED287]|nr:MAG: hypothetical protein CBE47_03020 [Pelagibacteraceae bacterium TMED287]